MSAKQILVVGGGPGGYVAAIRAAQLGAQVTVVEQEHLGGTCLNIGCIPTKCLVHSAELLEQLRQGGEQGVRVSGLEVDFPQMIAHKNKISFQLASGIGSLFRANHINKIDGTASFIVPGSLEERQYQGSTNHRRRNFGHRLDQCATLHSGGEGEPQLY